MDEHADALLDSLIDLLVEKGILTDEELDDQVRERLGATGDEDEEPGA